MGRLCERPGCSEDAALIYGMRPEDLVFWIDALRDGAPDDASVLCRRHGDTMTVPRNWTLDDLRDPELHLFRPPPRPEGPATRRNRSRRRSSGDETGQLELGGLVDELESDTPPDVASADDTAAEDEAPAKDVAPEEQVDEEVVEEVVAHDAPVDPDTPEPSTTATDESVESDEVPNPAVGLNWKPAFDDGDDLNGLLAARSPLLSRAFRGERG